MGAADRLNADTSAGDNLLAAAKATFGKAEEISRSEGRDLPMIKVSIS